MTLIPILLIFAVLFGSFCYSYFWGDFSERLGHEFYYGFVESLNYVSEIDYDKLYITSKTQGSEGGFVSEILTQFLLELDVGYTIGKTLSDGEQLKYEEKYYYGIEKNMIDENDESAVYIVRIDETAYFDEEIFEFKFFEDYCVVTHRHQR